MYMLIKNLLEYVSKELNILGTRVQSEFRLTLQTERDRVRGRERDR